MAITPTPLHALEHAILYGDARAVAALLDADPALVDARFPDNLNLTPLMWAARNRRETIVAGLLARGADVTLTNRLENNGDGGNTALWFAAQGAVEGGTAVARRLLDAGADVNTRGEHGRTALYIAAAWVHLELVQFLIERGADVNVADDEGHTPLAKLRADAAWCDRQPSLIADQQRFRERAPRVIAFLESCRGGGAGVGL